MINGQYLINDGLDNNNCKNNGQTTWTYNQGVILGGLANLATITKNQTLITIAQKIADAVYNTLVYSPGGVLKEPCEVNSDCGGDGPQFKGIFVRYLAILAKQIGSAKYITWMKINADSIWNTDRTSNNECGLKWVGPPGTVNAATHTSALDCFNANILLAM